MPSSVIHHMTYDRRTRELTIYFRGGRGTYRYYGVPLEEWNAFAASASKGTYLNTEFKAHNFRYERLVMQDEERKQHKDNQRQPETDHLEWPLPEATRRSGAYQGKADDLDGLTRGHEVAPASLRRSVSS